MDNVTKKFEVGGTLPNNTTKIMNITAADAEQAEKIFKMFWLFSKVKYVRELN